MNTPEIFQQKKEIRQRIEAVRRAMPRIEVRKKSRLVRSYLATLPEYQRAERIHSYVAWKNEVDTHFLIKHLLGRGKEVIVPFINLKNHALKHYLIKSFDDLQPGTFGILEPNAAKTELAEIRDIDLIIVPGVAFDLSGHRLGYGGGYYDAFLSRTKAVKVALAYHFQIIDKIPTRPEDQKVDMIVTEQGAFQNKF